MYLQFNATRIKFLEFHNLHFISLNENYVNQKFRFINLADFFYNMESVPVFIEI